MARVERVTMVTSSTRPPTASSTAILFSSEDFSSLWERLPQVSQTLPFGSRRTALALLASWTQFSQRTAFCHPLAGIILQYTRSDNATAIHHWSGILPNGIFTFFAARPGWRLCGAAAGAGVDTSCSLVGLLSFRGLFLRPCSVNR